MKRVLAGLCVLFFSTIGCVSMEPAYRGIDGNKYSSSSPKVTVVVANDLGLVSGKRGKFLPSLPTDPDVRVDASGSSYYGLAEQDSFE